MAYNNREKTLNCLSIFFFFMNEKYLLEYSRGDSQLKWCEIQNFPFMNAPNVTLFICLEKSLHLWMNNAVINQSTIVNEILARYAI